MITEEEALASARPGLFADLIVSALRIQNAANLLSPAGKATADADSIERAKQTLHLARALNMTIERPYTISVDEAVATLYAFNGDNQIVALKKWEPIHVTKLRKKWEKIVEESTDDLFLYECHGLLNNARNQTPHANPLAERKKGRKTHETKR